MAAAQERAAELVQEQEVELDQAGLVQGQAELVVQVEILEEMSLLVLNFQ